MHFDKYGRVLVKCKTHPQNKETIADVLIKEKLGYEYYGETKLSELDQI
jgi:endonuclease YncB( thermonuclease family)